MEISGDYMFDAPQQLVWDALQDPNVLGSVMPGGKEFTEIGDKRYSGLLEVKVGPVQGSFQGQIQLSDVVPPESYQIVVDGKGAPGFVKATGNMRLEARGQQTFMEYSGKAQIGGRIASVGQRLVESAARSIIRQSLDALNEYLKIQAAQQAALAPAPVVSTPIESAAGGVPVAAAAPVASVPPPISTYKPPSQMSLALNVARDVMGDFIPRQYQPLALGGIIFVILVIILLIAR
jgi:uncharacterized protein